MMNSAIDRVRGRAARIAGLAALLSFVTVAAVNFGIFEPLFIGAEAAQAAREIVAHQTFFRVGLAGCVLYCVLIVVLSAALHVVLKPVDPHLALLATVSRLAHGFVWVLITANLFTALRLLTGPEYAQAFPPDQLPVLARLYLSGFDQYYIGLLFWSLASTIVARLWLTSGYIPGALAVFGILASAWCAACTIVLFIFPAFQDVVNLWWFDTPMALFELALGCLLLFRGLRPSLIGA
jgi:Domain of unknown function (DUF4386)